MALTRGENYAVGVAVEATRGTWVAAQDYVRSREPATVQTVVEKVDIKETKATGVASQGQVVTMKKVEGDMALNLRMRTIGYFLKSFLGGVSSAVEAGETVVYRHTFTLDPAIQQPTLALSLARGTFPHKKVNGAVVSKMSMQFTTDDVINGSVSIKGLTEVTNADFTAGYSNSDPLVPHQFVTLKVADNVAGLAAAPIVCVTDLALEQDRGSREKLCISSESPVDMIAKLLSVSGKFNMDKTDDTYRELAIANTSKAIQISVVNTAQNIGVSSNPEITITLPNVTFTTSETRPLDDVVTEEVSFVAHYDDTEAKAITVSLVNEKANYNAA
jgi:hypothetical protein